MQQKYIVTFKNTLEAMNGEKIAKLNNIKVNVIPTPTYITKSCGISLLTDDINMKLIKKLVNNNQMSVKNIFFKDKNSIKEL